MHIEIFSKVLNCIRTQIRFSEKNIHKIAVIGPKQSPDWARTDKNFKFHSAGMMQLLSLSIFRVLWWILLIEISLIVILYLRTNEFFRRFTNLISHVLVPCISLLGRWIKLSLVDLTTNYSDLERILSPFPFTESISITEKITTPKTNTHDIIYRFTKAGN